MRKSDVFEANSRILDEEQSEEMHELALYPEKQGFGAICPYFFKKDASENVAVNCDRYCAIIIVYLLFEIEAREFIHFKRTFNEQVISRLGPVVWSLKLCIITPLDFFPGGYEIPTFGRHNLHKINDNEFVFK